MIGNQNSNENKKFKKRIVCPCCEEGFIKGTKKDTYERARFTGRSPIFTAPEMDYPTCSNCGTKFLVAVTKELEIELIVANR
ncbi:hypothetical protein UT300003_32670 [Clostridium sardiniense]